MTMTNLKTIEDLALAFANNPERQLLDCPRECKNPGLYFGYMAGVAAVMEELEVMGYDYTDLMVGGEFIPKPHVFGYDEDAPLSFECPVITSREKK